MKFIVLVCLFQACASSTEEPDSHSSATQTVSDLNQNEMNNDSNTVIVLLSQHNNNTAKVVNEMIQVLGAHALSPQQATPEVLSQYDLIGFGSGILDQKHHPEILETANNLVQVDNKEFFIISTSGVGRDVCLENNIDDPHETLRNILINKGCQIIGEFNCPGINKNSFLKIFGGINKGRPNDEDLANARNFAEKLLRK